MPLDKLGPYNLKLTQMCVLDNYSLFVVFFVSSEPSEPFSVLICSVSSNWYISNLDGLCSYIICSSADIGWHICRAEKRLRRELNSGPNKTSKFPSELFVLALPYSPLSFQIKLSAGLPVPNWTGGNRRICLLLSPAGMCISPSDRVEKRRKFYEKHYLVSSYPQALVFLLFAVFVTR